MNGTASGPGRWEPFAGALLFRGVAFTLGSRRWCATRPSCSLVYVVFVGGLRVSSPAGILAGVI